MLIVQINAKVRYSYLVLIITNNLRNKYDDSIDKRSMHEINKKTNSTFEQFDEIL